MYRFSIRDIALAAMVAAVYFVLSYFGGIFSLTFGPVQIRLAEALTVLPFLFPAAAPGLAVGCLITNLLSPYGVMDVFLGTLATTVAACLTMRVPRWYLAGLPPVLVNCLILPPMWAWIQVGGLGPAFWISCVFNLVTFVVGEGIACYVFGTFLLKTIPRTEFLRRYMARRVE